MTAVATGRSLGARLVLLTGAAVVLLIVALSLWVDCALAAAYRDQFDDALRTRMQALASLTEQEDGVVEFDYEGKHSRYEREELPAYFQFWLQDGTVLLRSTRLPADLPFVADGGMPHDVVLPSGRAVRVAALRFAAKGPADVVPGGTPDRDGPALAPEVVLAVAVGRETLDEQLLATHRVVLGSGFVTLLLCLLAVWWSVRRGLRPVRVLAQQVATLDPQDEQAEVTLVDPPRELLPVIEQLHALLRRAQAALQRERRFSGHVAHELRTPIAELQSLATIGARWPDDRAAVVGYFRDVGDVAHRMHGVIGDLLLLARCGAGVEAVTRETVDLATCLRTVCDQHAMAAGARRMQFDVEAHGDLRVLTDRGKLELLLVNLVGNAVAHGMQRSAIQCVVAGSAAAGVTLEIRNRAARGLSDDELQRVAEPFYRAGEPPADDERGGHVGLGLALVDALAQLLGLRVARRMAAVDEFRVRIAGFVQSPAEPALVRAAPPRRLA